MDMNKYIDHTMLKADTTLADIVKLCKEAKEHKFFSVCVNSSYVSSAKTNLEGSDVKLCSVVGFPLGAMSMSAKIFEAKQAVSEGADEIDMVINVGMLKSGFYDFILNEIKFIKEEICKVSGKDIILKVIIETCYLTETEIIKATELSIAGNADFVKTSTGFGSRGASLEDIKIISSVLKGKAKIKASGGIKNYETAKQYIDLGVDRIGTSSGIDITKSQK